jgi:hypothetical protein
MGKVRVARMGWFKVMIARPNVPDLPPGVGVFPRLLRGLQGRAPEDEGAEGVRNLKIILDIVLIMFHLQSMPSQTGSGS